MQVDGYDLMVQAIFWQCGEDYIEARQRLMRDEQDSDVDRRQRKRADKVIRQITKFLGSQWAVTLAGGELNVGMITRTLDEQAAGRYRGTRGTVVK